MEDICSVFERCCNIEYTTVTNDASFAQETANGTLYLYFEASKSRTDWKNNFDFPAVPYRRMEESAVWRAHRGFVKVWKSAEGHLSEIIAKTSAGKIVIAGYSHGGALAVLCHEYVWFHRPDLRSDITGYGFGCPRVVFGILPEDIRKRWEGFTVIRNKGDIVTHLPPVLLGYSHVGKILEIGEKGKYPPSEAHSEESIMRELLLYKEK